MTTLPYEKIDLPAAVSFDILMCIVCRELPSDSAKTVCCHQIICANCIREILKTDDKCPSCRTPSICMQYDPLLGATLAVYPSRMLCGSYAGYHMTSVHQANCPACLIQLLRKANQINDDNDAYILDLRIENALLQDTVQGLRDDAEREAERLRDNAEREASPPVSPLYVVNTPPQAQHSPPPLPPPYSSESEDAYESETAEDSYHSEAEDS